MKLFFPHESVRPVQADFMRDIEHALEHRQNLLAHAPTGLGKTASVLSVAIPFAIEHNLTIFFLTNRHTQHQIALDTLQGIRKKYDQSIIVADLIGKKWMCLQDGVGELYNQEFIEYCKAVRESETCTFYSKLYKNNSSEMSVPAHKMWAEVIKRAALGVGEIKTIASAHGICPYYFSSELAKKAQVVVADYSTVFYAPVQQSFFSRAGKELEKSIIIVDEGHNLAERIRASSSTKLSDAVIRFAIKEALDFGFSRAAQGLRFVQDTLEKLAVVFGERLVSREDFMTALSAHGDYDLFVDDFEAIGNKVREEKKRSFVGSVGEFLHLWKGEEKSFLRYVEKRSTSSGVRTTLYFTCLDAAAFSAPLFEKAYSTIIMSGTLIPTSMFGDVLGVSRRAEKIYPSPFPPENRLALVVPETSTKYQLRSDVMFKRIAAICADIVRLVPGNSAIFFPSYELKTNIVRFLIQQVDRTIFDESAAMGSEEKTRLLEAFKSSKDKGAVLCAVASANFSEGVDLPGDLLKAVVVVGLPLARPDVRTRALIQYYDAQFGKGWDYGYTFPALTKCLQAAGRCIRSETDKGVIIFLDQRFAWPRYYHSLPPDWKVEVTRDYADKIRAFFEKSASY